MLADHLVFPILLSKDLAASRAFYHDTLGLEILREDDERIIFRCGAGSQVSVTLSTVGTAESRRWQAVVPSLVRPRVAQALETSAYAPLDRMRPPSEPLNQTVGSPGLVTSTCWSGWMELGVVGEVASKVRSVKVRLL